MNEFLPISMEEVRARGWNELDFIIVSGDAYVDHPSFGTAVIGRVLESRGYRVGIIAQPDWRSEAAFKVMGRPRYGFLVGTGNIDSMVCHYTTAKRKRSQDNYSPGGKAGFRPDRALITYCNMIRKAYKDVAIVAGGIEASLRRFAHYDYWDDKVRSSVLLDSGADIIVYGMGERQIGEVADALASGIDVKYINYIAGTVCKVSDTSYLAGECIEVPSYEQVCESREKYAQAFRLQHDNQDPIRGKTLVQKHGGTYVVQNPPVMPLNREELDDVYRLPFARTYHPSYEKMGGVPAISEVKFSILSERGCFGSCAFCAIGFHQGRIVQSRSHESILEEAELMAADKEFKGYIHDVGGATANFREPSCQKQLREGTCKNVQCLYPKPCKNLTVDHSDYLSLLRKLRAVRGVKKVFVRSGIRYDYLMADKNSKGILKEICSHHVSGQLKVAPEHISQNVLKRMRKPGGEIFKKFVYEYEKVNKELGMNQYMVPYLMSSHPGATLSDAVELAVYLHESGLYPEQVQDFYPTPGTLSTAMYHTGIDPMAMEKVYVAKSSEEKAMQRALLQYRNPKNYNLVLKALKTVGRHDLIGYGRECLVRPPRGEGETLRQGERSDKTRRKSKANPGNKGGSGKPRKRSR